LLRDDKSFPLSHLPRSRFPQSTKPRATEQGRQLFGPFARGAAVNRTWSLWQKRACCGPCTTAIFAAPAPLPAVPNSSGAAAPCVGLISHASIPDWNRASAHFPLGRSMTFRRRDGLGRNAGRLRGLDFEGVSLALIQYRIRALSLVQGTKTSTSPGRRADVIRCRTRQADILRLRSFSSRRTEVGHRAYFPSHDVQLSVEEVLTSFGRPILDNRTKPPLVLLSHRMVEAGVG